MSCKSRCFLYSCVWIFIATEVLFCHAMNETLSSMGNVISENLQPKLTYCKMCCLTPTDKVCNTHTMCIYSAQGHGPNCQGYRSMSLNEKEKQELLDAHNLFRNHVALGFEMRGDPGPQPPAADMREMMWDNELETIASRWADQCLPGNDKCRDVSRFPVGQNIAIGSFTDLNLTNYVLKWYNEVTSFNPNLVTNYEIPKLGWPNYAAYTQLMWSDTYTLGCARVLYHTGTSQLHYKEYLICNYGPAGNMVNNHIYRTGEACSQCPIGLKCATPTYNGLCYNANRASQVENCANGGGKSCQPTVEIDAESNYLKFPGHMMGERANNIESQNSSPAQTRNITGSASATNTLESSIILMIFWKQLCFCFLI